MRWRVVGPVYWRIEWKFADCWIGCFTDWRDLGHFSGRHVWLCLLPCLPLHLFWRVRRDG